MNEDFKNSKINVAFFGGSFNPPHIGHVQAIVYAITVLKMDRVLVVPVFQHPFAKELASFEDRFAMCQLATGFMPQVSVLDIEKTLGGDSYTLRTLKYLQEEHPDWKMRILLGRDVEKDTPKWHGFDEIETIAEPLWIPRSGISENEKIILPNVSSTEVRNAIRNEEMNQIKDRIPYKVLDYVLEKKLYTSC